MSRERSGPAAMPKVEQSSPKTKQSKALDLDKVKVFAKPEYRLPYHLAMYTNSPKKKASVPAPLWLQAAVESGLVEMGPPSADGLRDGLLSPLDGHPPIRMKPGELDRMLRDGIARTLRQLEQSQEALPTELVEDATETPEITK